MNLNGTNLAGRVSPGTTGDLENKALITPANSLTDIEQATAPNEAPKVVSFIGRTLFSTVPDSLFGVETHFRPEISQRCARLQQEIPDSFEDPIRRVALRDLIDAAIHSGVSSDEVIARLACPVVKESDRSQSYQALMAAATKEPLSDAGLANQSALITRTDGKRVDYARIEGSPVVAALQGLASAVSYNSAVGIPQISGARERYRLDSNYEPRNITGEVEDGVNVNLNWSEASALRAENVAARRASSIQVWLPCHAEPGAAHLNLAYAAGAVSGENIICVNTNRQGDARVRLTQQDLGLQASQVPGVTLGLQDRLLRCIDWAQVEEDFALQLERSEFGDVLAPGGSKGMTLLAIALVAEARQQMQGSYVMMHDTDIINPWQYNAIEYLSIPLHLRPDAPGLIDDARGWDGIYLARTGSGRNNQPLHSALNGIISERNPRDEGSKFAKELAVNCVIAPWLLTGERVIRGDLLRTMPWVNDMTIESQINVLLAGEAVQRQRLVTAHVFDPMPKIENADVAASREWRMMNFCAQHHRDLIAACGENRQVLATWSDREIRRWNLEHARFNSVGAITNDASHSTNLGYASSRPWMLPSIAMLREMNLVDWGQVLDVAAQDTGLLKKRAKNLAAD